MARPKKVNDNAEFLTYALLHLEKERDIILGKIANIRQQLGVGTKKAPAVAATKTAGAEETGKVRKPRVLSAAARKSISLAQKKRWAAARKAQ